MDIRGRMDKEGYVWCNMEGWMEMIFFLVWYRKTERKDDDIYMIFLLKYLLIQILLLSIIKLIYTKEVEQCINL